MMQSALRITRRGLVPGLAASMLACGPTGTGPGVSTPDASGERLVVTGRAALAACPVCPERARDPALSYLTPSVLHEGLRRVELLRAADDPSPHVLVEESPAPRDLDLIAGATFADVAAAAIPLDTYTQLRVTLAYTLYEVPATGHAPGFGAFPGTLRVSYATSDYDDSLLGPRRQGEYLAELEVNGSVPPGARTAGVQPVAFPPPYPGAATDASAGEYRVTFPIPGGPIEVGPGAPATVQLEVVYYLQDGFGWQDRAEAGYTTGVLDLSMNPALSETPAYLGVDGFSVTAR